MQEPVEPPLAQQNNECPDLVKLKQELREELLREMRNVEALKAQSTHHTSVFSEVIMAAPFPNNFKM